MSDGSQSDSEADIVDLTSEDDLSEEVQDHGTPPAIELVMMVDGHGEAVNHNVEGPDSIDSMDSEESDVSDDEIEDNDSIDNDPDDDDGGIEDNDPVDDEFDDSDPGDPGGDSDDDGDGDDENDGFEDDEPDDDAWSDAGTETDTDDDPINNDDVEGNVMHGHKNENATIAQCLEEEGILIPEWNGNCIETCQPGWDGLAGGFQSYRNMFLQKRNELATCRATNKRKLTRKNRSIRPFKEAVREFYKANRANIELNRALHRENAALRQLVSEDDLENFPETVPLPLNDVWAGLPEAVRKHLPPRYSKRLRLSREPGARQRITEKEWPQVYLQWIQHRYHPDITDWRDIYKISCREENMSWAFSQRQKPKTHPDLRLRAPTDAEEERGILNRGCTPLSGSKESSSNDEGEIQPFPFEDLPRKIQLEILAYALVFNGDVVHAISRLDPYYEPDSVHRNCKGQISLFHRFHIGKEPVSLTFGTIHPQWLLAPLLGRFAKNIGHKLQILQHVELLWIGSQKLTYELDEKKKYTSRRTHDLAHFPEACRLKTLSVHIPESSPAYMRRKHEPRDMIEYMEEKTAAQPNYRPFRALRTVQGLDYLYCLRGLQGITFWDYDKWNANDEMVAVRDWTFIQDVNNTVRRDKLPDDEHFSNIRYLAPIMEDCRPSVALAARLERFINPPSTGLLTPPPDLFPQLQAVHDTEDGSGDEATDDGAVMPPPEITSRESDSRGRGESSLFVPTPTPEVSLRPPFKVKVETPTPQRSAPPESASGRNRSESSLFMGTPPSQPGSDPREGGIDCPIDLTQDFDLQRQKRSFCSGNDDDEYVCTGSSPKRARTDDASGMGIVPRRAAGPFVIDDD
ncbi:hypothetical protein NW752_011274 [Fusarium irregulare]|uniref:Uncharacterized protein n=1 Tax=Fusarium irregulare TaxID=2494466 RepID=A0A9W8PFM7_9HYPO|nr:hypothetical protein NW766_011382 [Fusarium irregulare]KAJ4005311.1 hypothetical protein NW752_011274 [Fusarium irregulare]